MCTVAASGREWAESISDGHPFLSVSLGGALISEKLMSLPLIGTIPRPSMCPFCGGKAVDTLAKVITVTTYWRCRVCDKTWTIASQTAPPRPT